MSPRYRHLSFRQPWEQGSSEPREHGIWSPQDLEAGKWGPMISSQGLPTLTPLMKGQVLSLTFWASSTYQRSLWGRGQQQAARSGYGATRSQPRWPVGSCHNSLQGSTHRHSGATVPLQLWPGSPALPVQPQACNQPLLLASLGYEGLAHSREGHPSTARALPSQPLVVTSAKGLSQRSHWRPMTPGLHGHWPSSGSQTRDREPVG